MTEQATAQWKLWNGYGPLPDSMMRVERIGPKGGGLTTEYGSSDIRGSVEHLELVITAVNAHSLALRLAEAVLRMYKDVLYPGKADIELIQLARSFQAAAGVGEKP